MKNLFHQSTALVLVACLAADTVSGSRLQVAGFDHQTRTNESFGSQALAERPFFPLNGHKLRIGVVRQRPKGTKYSTPNPLIDDLPEELPTKVSWIGPISKKLSDIEASRIRTFFALVPGIFNRTGKLVLALAELSLNKEHSAFADSELFYPGLRTQMILGSETRRRLYDWYVGARAKGITSAVHAGALRLIKTLQADNVAAASFLFSWSKQGPDNAPSPLAQLNGFFRKMKEDVIKNHNDTEYTAGTHGLVRRPVWSTDKNPPIFAPHSLSVKAQAASASEGSTWKSDIENIGGVMAMIPALGSLVLKATRTLVWRDRWAVIISGTIESIFFGGLVVGGLSTLANGNPMGFQMAQGSLSVISFILFFNVHWGDLYYWQGNQLIPVHQDGLDHRDTIGIISFRGLIFRIVFFAALKIAEHAGLGFWPTIEAATAAEAAVHIIWNLRTQGPLAMPAKKTETINAGRLVRRLKTNPNDERVLKQLQRVASLAISNFRDIPADERDHIALEALATISTLIEVGGLKDPNALISLVVTVAQNSAKGYLRKQKVRLSHVTTIENLNSDERFLSLDDSPEQAIQRSERGEWVHAALRDLEENNPIRYRIVVLHHLLEYKLEAIAQEMGMSEGSVKSNLFRGRAYLKRLLEENYEKFSAAPVLLRKTSPLYKAA